MSDTGENGKRWLSVPEIALMRGVSTRTVERWIEKGRVESRIDAEGRRQVLGAPCSVLGRTETGTVSPSPGTNGGQVSDTEHRAPSTEHLSLEVERLKGRLDGAQTAAKIQAKRAEEAREEGARVEALMREIKLKLEEENAYLREQLDKRAEEGHQLRVLLHQSELNVGRLTEKILALPGERPRPWWMFWRRG